jgi:hypothetical protein
VGVSARRHEHALALEKTELQRFVSEYLDVYDWLEALWALSLAVQIEGGKDYDLRDLENLLRWDRPDHAMTGRVKDGFRFLARMSDLEGELTKDKARRSMAEIERLKAEALKRIG